MKFEETKRRVEEGEADLVAFASLFVGNPDLPERLKNGWPLVQADPQTYFSPGDKGFIDFPKYTKTE